MRCGASVSSPVKTHDAGGYFDLAPVDQGEECRRDIVLAMEAGFRAVGLISLVISQLTQLERETRALLEAVRYIRGFASPQEPRPGAGVPAARAPLDPDWLIGVLRVMVVLWLNLLLYIYVPDLPVASGLVIVGNVFEDVNYGGGQGRNLATAAAAAPATAAATASAAAGTRPCSAPSR